MDVDTVAILLELANGTRAIANFVCIRPSRNKDSILDYPALLFVSTQMQKNVCTY